MKEVVFHTVQSVTVYTPDLALSLPLYKRLGLEQVWTQQAPSTGGFIYVGLRFPRGGPELVLHNNVQRQFTEVEVVVDDVWRTYEHLSRNPDYLWLDAPHRSGRGWQAMVRVPDGNVFTVNSFVGDE